MAIGCGGLAPTANSNAASSFDHLVIETMPDHQVIEIMLETFQLLPAGAAQNVRSGSR
jgi:hypothetical protein